MNIQCASYPPPSKKNMLYCQTVNNYLQTSLSFWNLDAPILGLEFDLFPYSNIVIWLDLFF